VESLPKVVKLNTWPPFILDSFDCWKFAFLDLIHKFPWATFFVHNFFNFVIKERPFQILDHVFEATPIFEASRVSVSIKRKLAVIVLPCLGVFHDFDGFLVSLPQFFDIG